jgi:hypothetical protein
MFVPSMAFCILIDTEILIQCYQYKPVAFTKPPKYSIQILMAIGIVSLAVSAVLFFFSFLAFTPLVTPPQMLLWFFVTLMVKAVAWSPFIALELYDTVFENIYYDVNFQNNPIKPQTKA